MDPEQARELVLTERQRLETLHRERENEIGDGEKGNTGELSSLDQHPGDMGTETFEREKDFSILEGLESEINDLDAALKKIDEGTYGICEIGGESIETERLEAMPGARTCIKHADAR
jgi:DnaK suppressor protein